jgi:hypothetical protein
MHRMEHYSRDDYFPPATTSRAEESVANAADTTHNEKRKPLLLLVEDNEINLQVCRDHGSFSRL